MDSLHAAPFMGEAGPCTAHASPARAAAPARHPPVPACRACVMARHCTPAAGDGTARYPVPYAGRRRIRRGESLYRAGDPLHNLYPLLAGTMKIRTVNQSGVEQITGFPMAGSLLGLDGLETGSYACDAVALEDCQVCVLPYDGILLHCSRDAATLALFNRLVAQDIGRYRQLLFALGCMNTQERIAAFLLDISRRMAAGGYSSREFTLKMSREDIANHLGMTLETVSRMLARLHAAKLVGVDRRHLEIRDPQCLARLASGTGGAGTGGAGVSGGTLLHGQRRAAWAALALRR